MPLHCLPRVATLAATDVKMSSCKGMYALVVTVLVNASSTPQCSLSFLSIYYRILFAEPARARFRMYGRKWGSGVYKASSTQQVHVVSRALGEGLARCLLFQMHTVTIHT